MPVDPPPLAERSQPGRKLAARRVRDHGGDRSAARDRRRKGDRRRAVPEVGGRGRSQHPRQPACLGAHEQSGALPAGEAGGRHRAHPALHLPRSQRAVHSVGPAGRERRRHSQSDLHHRRSAEDGRLSRRDCGLRCGLDRAGQHRPQPESRPRSRRQSHRNSTAFVIAVGANPGVPTSTRRFAASNTR